MKEAKNNEKVKKKPKKCSVRTLKKSVFGARRDEDIYQKALQKSMQVKEKNRALSHLLSKKTADYANVCLHNRRFFNEEAKENMPIVLKSKTSFFFQ